MLNRLFVSNLAVVEKVEVFFTKGLNVLTGETGAGKSVLIGALELILGARADGSIVRDGANEARVEASFSLGKKLLQNVAEILDDAGLPECENDELVIRRTIPVSGNARVWVNDAQTTVSTLKKIGNVLVDIHGPRANQLILEERFQRDTLDSYASTEVEAYARAWQNFSEIQKKITTLESSRASEDELDLLRYQVAECEEAGLSEEDETIVERHAAAANAGEILEIASDITNVLGGERSVADLLSRLQPKFHALAKHLPNATQWASEAEDLTVRAQELSRAIADASSRLDTDPDALQELDARLTLVNRLKRKYGKGGTITDLLQTIEAKKLRLQELENSDAILEKLYKEKNAAKDEVISAGEKLSKARNKVAEKLSKAITKELCDLGFLQAKFFVRLSPIEPTSFGCDQVEYMLAPNPGEQARSLAAIASSGEAARVMLAIKSVLASHDAVDVLVFDEIDANIGGETGRAVGEKMRSVSLHHQVIAITHLPQSAVYGENHLIVAKAVVDGRTRTHIDVATDESRVNEIARMLGGTSATVIAHARELLSQVRKV